MERSCFVCVLASASFTWYPLIPVLTRQDFTQGSVDICHIPSQSSLPTDNFPSVFNFSVFGGCSVLLIVLAVFTSNEHWKSWSNLYFDIFIMKKIYLVFSWDERRFLPSNGSSLVLVIVNFSTSLIQELWQFSSSVHIKLSSLSQHLPSLVIVRGRKFCRV